MVAETMRFGRHKGKALTEIAAKDPSYLEWLVRQPALYESVREACLKALAGSRSEATSPTTPEGSCPKCLQPAKNLYLPAFSDVAVCAACVKAMDTPALKVVA